MKTNRLTRLFCVVLSLILAFNLMSYTASAKYFPDIYVGMLEREFFDAMNYVADNGWMNGVDATHFGPYVNITRGMFVTILYRYSGSTEQYSCNFTDVPASTYYYFPIGWANHYGIVNGVTETTFAPEQVITKEQMAVILYRFAQNYEDRSYTPSSFSSISNHPDYSSVSPYAIEAIRWAKTYRVFPLSEDTHYISPLANMNRAYTALYITNYSKNITGFTSHDRFPFENDGDAFHPNYVLGTYATKRLYSCIDNYYGDDVISAAADKAIIKAKVGTTWRGSCFGYTLCTFLDKIGKIDFNKTIANNATHMSTVGIPKNNVATIESAINYYQFLHSVSRLEDAFIEHYSGYSLAFGIESTYLYFQEYGAVPFSYFWTSGGESHGHTVLLTNITRNSAGTQYTLSVINPNSEDHSSPEQEIITINGGNVYYSGTKLSSIECYPISAIHLLDHFDLDGDHNNVNYTMTSGTNSSSTTPVNTTTNSQSVTLKASELPTLETTTLLLPFSKFKITNAEGKMLAFDGNSLTGDLKILDTREMPNGPDHPSTLILTVERSSSFEYHNLSNKSTIFSVITPNFFSRISGDNIESVTIDSSQKTLSAAGRDMIYSLWLDTGIAGYEHFYLEGQNSTAFSLCTLDQNISFDNLEGPQKFGFSDQNSISAATTQLNFCDGCIMDLSELSNSNSVLFSYNGFSDALPLPDYTPIK